MTDFSPFSAYFPRAVSEALLEDVSGGDVTTASLFAEPIRAHGRIFAEESHGMILAGIAIAIEVFRQVDPLLLCTPAAADKDRLVQGATILNVTGDGRSLLQGERVALNFLQRLSGIATLTSKFCEAVKGTSVRILDTRKTTPGIRILEKWAVRLGGGYNHRYGLYDGILIKDNHLALFGGDIARAVRTARARAPHTLKVEVETCTLHDVEAALQANADVILLDNMSIDMIQQAICLVKGRALTEVSGGVTLQNVREVAHIGPDFISIGALTHSAPAVNISMDVTPL